MKQETLKRIST